MKTVPLKKSVDVDIAGAISAFVTRNCGSEHLEPLLALLESIQKSRKDVVAALSNPTNPLEQTLQALRLWLSYIAILEDRLPFGGSNGVDVRFSWTCSFMSKASVSLPSIQFEKLCTLYNIGATHSCLAYASDRTSAEGGKEAIKEFLSAASVFSSMKAQLPSSDREAFPPDISEATLSLYVALMSAQAQTCVYEKAVKDQLNRSLLSKLATQVANFYCSAGSFTGSVPQLPRSLSSWLQIQRMAFLSAAHYQRSLFDLVEVERRSDGYGGIVARLRCAVNICLKAIKEAQTAGLTADLTALREAAEQKLKSLEKDNKTVYLEVVPPEASLLPLEAVRAVTLKDPLPSSDLYIEVPGAREVFDLLVPLKVRPAMEEFDGRASALLNDAQSVFSSLSKKIEAFCWEHGLPFIVLEETQISPHHSLWKKIEEVQAQGGVIEAEKWLAAVESGAETCRSTLESLVQRFLQENKTDDQYMATYGPGWKRPGSHESAEIYWQTIQKYQAKLELAIQANQIVRDSLDRAMPWKEMLTRAQDAIEASLPQDSGLKKETETSQLAKQKVRLALDSVLSCASSIETEIDTFNNFKMDARSRLTAAFTKAPDSNPSAVGALVNQEMDAIEMQSRTIHLECDKCEELLKTASNVWKEQELKIVTLQSQERLEALKSLDAAATAVCRVQHDAKDGLNFFGTLSQYIKTLSQQVNDYLIARREDALQILKASTVPQYSNSLPPSAPYVQAYSNKPYIPAPPISTLSHSAIPTQNVSFDRRPYVPAAPIPTSSYSPTQHTSNFGNRLSSQASSVQDQRWPHYPQQQGFPTQSTWGPDGSMHRPSGSSVSSNNSTQMYNSRYGKPDEPCWGFPAL